MSNKIDHRDEKPKQKRPAPKKERKVNFSIWYFIFAFLAMVIFESIMMRRQTDQLSYSKFKELLIQDRLIECYIAPEKIEGLYFSGDTTLLAKAHADYLKVLQEKGADSSPRSFKYFLEGQVKDKLIDKKNLVDFSTVRVTDPDLVKELEQRSIEFTGKTGGNWLQSFLLIWILPLILLFGIWMLLFRRINTSGGMMSIGRSKAKIYVEGQTKITFKDVAGIDEAVEEVGEIVEFLQNPEKFQKLGGHIPKGVLLVGPPGTGKTLLAKAVAGEAKVPFFSLSGSDFVEMFVGVGAARVRDLFQQASNRAPCIIFIDELDALGKARGIGIYSGHDEREQTLNQLLAEMDGFETNAGVIIMAATNRPEILDLALLRPGRFDRQVVVDRPDIKGREAILRVHAKNVKLESDVDLHIIAARTPGFVGADLANVINEAALLAARHSKKSISSLDLEEAIDRVIAGLERKSRIMNKNEKTRVAYHESGHAIVAARIEGCDPVHRVSIIPRGVAALGYTLQLPTEDRYLMTKSELIAKLKVLLGGRVAEEIKFSEVSTGALNDLARATDIARSMVVEYGMSEAIGPISYGRGSRSFFLGTEVPDQKVYSESLAAQIDAEVKSIVEEAQADVRKLLKEHTAALEELAQRLLVKEVIEKEELQEIFFGSASS